jgi:hypothetical protein
MKHENNGAQYPKIQTNTVKVKGKTIPVPAMKAYGVE